METKPNRNIKDFSRRKLVAKFSKLQVSRCCQIVLIGTTVQIMFLVKNLVIAYFTIIGDRRGSLEKNSQRGNSKQSGNHTPNQNAQPCCCACISQFELKSQPSNHSRTNMSKELSKAQSRKRDWKFEPGRRLSASVGDHPSLRLKLLQNWGILKVPPP